MFPFNAIEILFKFLKFFTKIFLYIFIHSMSSCGNILR